VVDRDGKALGAMTPDEGRELARQAGLDLVEVAPNERPPICKIIDYGKFKYERSKRSQHRSSSTVKTVQLRPKTDTHDLETKLGQARRFLRRGDTVKVVMRLRGREQSFIGRAIDILRQRVREGLSEVGSVASPPAHRGRQITLMVEPNRR
jgi:translation initiation factor IF-3